MQAFGLEITRAKNVATRGTPVSENRGGWLHWVSERYAGAWQKNDTWTTDSVLAFHAVYACLTLIASDIGSKMRPKLMEQGADRIWKEITSPAFSPVLRKPNRYQNRIQFLEWWVMSKLLRGNAYVLLERDRRGVVVAMYLLDPARVTPLVTPDGSVYYELKPDNLSGLATTVTVPASEIIHDRMNCLYHPLVGTSPIFACGAAANIGITIEGSSASFFANGSKVSGQLLIPTSIPQEKATELRERWKNEFSGENSGQIAVLSGGMKFEPMQMTAVDAQLIEHLQMSEKAVCSAFHVPPWKVHVGEQPAYTKPDIAEQQYYSACLQSHVEEIELCLDEGLGIGEDIPIEGKIYGVELDLDNLLRMDAATLMDVLTKAAGGPVYTPNEARAKAEKSPLPGGDTLYRQQQDFSLEALTKRDAKADPFATSTPAPPPPKPAPVETVNASQFLTDRMLAKRREMAKVA